jgi:hypothetical protein
VNVKKNPKKYFQLKKIPRNILKWKLAGSHLYSARQELSLGAESAILFFRLQHGASGAHHERAVQSHLCHPFIYGSPAFPLLSRTPITKYIYP